MKDCELILNSDSDGRFAEIGPFRYWVERDGGVDHYTGVDAVDVDTDAAIGVNEELVHNDLSRFAFADHTSNRVQKLVTPEDVVGKIVKTCSEHLANGLISLTVDYRTNGLRRCYVEGQGGVDQYIMDDRVLRKSEESGVLKSCQRNTHQGSSRWIGGEGDEPRLRIDVALDHGKKVTGSERRIPLKPGGLI